jgi:hypothetical protein
VTDRTELRTVYLGQFEHATADRIAGALEDAGIYWTYKQFGRLTRLLFAGDWGVRLYVESSRFQEAGSLVEQIKGSANQQGS